MNLKEQVAADMAAIFLNVNEFADEIQYNGVTIKAVFSAGETNIRSDYKNEGTQDCAFIRVSREDVPNPKVNDEVVCDNEKYKMIRIASRDSSSFKLELAANQSVMPKRSGLRGV